MNKRPLVPWGVWLGRVTVGLQCVREISLGVRSMLEDEQEFPRKRVRRRAFQAEGRHGPRPCCGHRNQPGNTERGRESSAGMNGEVS